MFYCSPSPFTVPWKELLSKKLHWIKALSESLSESRTPCILLLASICIGESKKKESLLFSVRSIQEKGSKCLTLRCAQKNFPPNTMLCIHVLYAWQEVKRAMDIQYIQEQLLEEENFLWSFAPTLTNILSKLLFPHVGPLNNMVLIYRRFLDAW